MSINKIAEKFKLKNYSIALTHHHNEPTIYTNTQEQRFPIYSLTKTYISTLLLKLAQEEQVSLEDPLKLWIPDAPLAEKYTLRQLLNNTSGLPDYFHLENYKQAVKKNASHPWTRKEYIENTFQGKLLFEPGCGWSYSNLGFMFLREVIEKLTSLTFAETLSKYICPPLKLNDTVLISKISDFNKVIESESKHLNSEESLLKLQGNYHPGWVAHGVIASTTTDSLHFLQNIFEGTFLNKESLQQMTTLISVPGKHPPFVSPRYGLGIMGDPDSKWGPTFGHGGGGPGYAIHASYYPEFKGGTYLAVFCNSEEAAIPFVMDEILESIKA